MIERKMLIGLIVSTDYLHQIQYVWNERLLGSQVARLLSRWCWDHFNKYKKAPGRDIEQIFYSKLKTEKRMSKELAQEIEEDILPGLSNEHENENINLDVLIDQTKNYFKERQLYDFQERIKALTDEGELLEAEKLASSFKSVGDIIDVGLDFGNKNILKNVEKAFSISKTHVIQYTRQLGFFINDYLIRGAFVAFMATEKRGKTFMLIELTMKALQQNSKVAFFEAGDMTEDQLIRRIAIYLTKKSDNPKYSGKMFEPVKDCINNQLDLCEKKVRECDFGIFDDKDEDFLRKKVTIDDLKERYEKYPDYSPCYNCKQYYQNKWGAVWIKEVNSGEPLTMIEAKKAYRKFFVRNKKQFRLSVHPNGTLTMKIIDNILQIWEKQDGFIPDLIVLDYIDLIEDFEMKEFRHKQNKIWKDARGINQRLNNLFITATQADAGGYGKDTLGLENFSEDKRKYGHVTAMFGLNQDSKGREKKLKLMRINQLVIREGEYDITQDQITILQNLQRGQIMIGNYF